MDTEILWQKVEFKIHVCQVHESPQQPPLAYKEREYTHLHLVRWLRTLSTSPAGRLPRSSLRISSTTSYPHTASPLYLVRFRKTQKGDNSERDSKGRQLRQRLTGETTQIETHRGDNSDRLTGETTHRETGETKLIEKIPSSQLRKTHRKTHRGENSDKLIHRLFSYVWWQIYDYMYRRK